MWTGVHSFPDLEAGDNTTLLGLCPRAEWENIKQGPPVADWPNEGSNDVCVPFFSKEASLILYPVSQGSL